MLLICRWRILSRPGKRNSDSLLNQLKNKGNEYRTKISEFEEKKRILENAIQKEILSLPNFPSKDAPIGKDENNNIQLKTWGDPLKKENLKSKSKNTPIENRNLQGQVIKTFVKGELAFERV